MRDERKKIDRMDTKEPKRKTDKTEADRTVMNYPTFKRKTVQTEVRSLK